MKIGIPSKNQPFARRADNESHLPKTIPGTANGNDVFGGWGPKL